MNNVRDVLDGLVEGSVFSDVVDDNKGELREILLDGFNSFELADDRLATHGGADFVAFPEGFSKGCKSNTTCTTSQEDEFACHAFDGLIGNGSVSRVGYNDGLEPYNFVARWYCDC